MNWLNKLSQAKPMPLPFNRPDESELSYHGYDRSPHGIDQIDNYMTQDTADQVRKEFNPEYLGSGSQGVAIDLGNNKVGKLTFDDEEIAMANHLIKHPCPCVVKVYEVREVQKQHTDTERLTRTERVFMIIMEKVKELTYMQREIAMNGDWKYPYQSKEWYERRRKSTIEGSPRMIAGFIDALFSLQDNLAQCGIVSDDLRAENVGINAEGNLVLLDLGASSIS